MIAEYLQEAGYATGCIGKWHNTGSIGEWDGRDLLPYWRGETTDPPHEVLYWGQTDGSRLVVRRGPWKLIKESEDRQGQPELALYDLREDIGEKHNQIDSETQMADQLMTLYEAWRKQMIQSATPHKSKR